MRVGWGLTLLVVGCGRIAFDPLVAHQTGACMNAILDSGEVGVDCGGPCLPCAATACANDSQCATDHCIAGVCELATAPPFWVPGPDLTTVRQGARAVLGSAGELYVIGGHDGVTSSRRVDVLAPGAAAFAVGPAMIEGRENHAVANIGGTIYAFGSGSVPNALEALTGGTWQQRQFTVTSHGWIDGAAGLDGKFYVPDLYELSVYTPGADSWASLPSPPDARDQIGVTRAIDGLIYVIGGRTNMDGLVLVDAYDVPKGTWSRRAPLPQPRVFSSAVAAPDGRIYSIGGGISATETAASVDAYTAARDRWAAVTPLRTSREQMGAALDAKGRIFACGGLNATGRLATTEIYGPDITLTPAQAAPGQTVTISHDNFAAYAAVAVTIDGAYVAGDITNFEGTATTSFVVPQLAPGPHEVTAIDNRSLYPVTTVLDVQ